MFTREEIDILAESTFCYAEKLEQMLYDGVGDRADYIHDRKDKTMDLLSRFKKLMDDNKRLDAFKEILIAQNDAIKLLHKIGTLK